MTAPSGSPASTVSPPAEEFSIALEVRQGCRVVFLVGDLDELAAPELDRAIGEHPHGGAVVVDLSRLAFIASAGIHVLLRDRPGGAPAVVCPPGHVARVLEIVGAPARMRLFEDVATAVETLSNGQTCERADARSKRHGPSIWLGRSHEKRHVSTT